MSVEDQLRIRKLRQKLFGDKRSFSLNSASTDQTDDQQLRQHPSLNKNYANESSMYDRPCSGGYDDLGERDFQPKLPTYYGRLEPNGPPTTTAFSPAVPSFSRRSSRQDTAANVENWICQTTTTTTRKPLLFNYKEK
uniref:Uncharacterized protein n=1 Tax=Romanomermis culicivorax TaxID=13658 RepID=A0A915JIJ1_ROMCU